MRAELATQENKRSRREGLSKEKEGGRLRNKAAHSRSEVVEMGRYSVRHRGARGLKMARYLAHGGVQKVRYQGQTTWPG